MRAFRIDENTGEFGTIEVEPRLEEYYRLIGCECIDIVTREVGGTGFNIVVDDEGLLRGGDVTAASLTTGEVLVGTILLFGIDDEGDLRPLTDTETNTIRTEMCVGIMGDGTMRNILSYR